MLGASRKMIGNKWNSVKVSITLSFSRKLIKLPDTVRAGHKHDLVLAISEYCVYQSKNSRYKQTHMKVTLNGHH